jgi:CRP/FNR family transcriptional regulator, anaerobic regulatory protein
MLRTNYPFLEYIQELFGKQTTRNILVKTFKKGSQILVQNQPSSAVMLLKSGISKVFISEQNEKEYIFEFLGKGEIVGEIEVIRDINCLCTVQAMTDVEVFVIDENYFRGLLKSDLTLNNLLNDEFAQRIINTCQRASYQQLYTTEYNLSKLFKMLDKQNIGLSKEEMAAYLGVTIRSLNRALKSIGQ